MRTEIRNILSLPKFFQVRSSAENHVTVKLLQPSRLLAKNIYINWLQSIWNKAENNFPVFLKDNVNSKHLPAGVIKADRQIINSNVALNYNPEGLNTDGNSKLVFTLTMTQQDGMPYFIQWQRYRKFWWSSITTTPSTFSLEDIKYEEKFANVDIVVKMPWHEQTVEKVSIETSEMNNTMSLKCETNLNDALVVLLADATVSNTEEGYLRLHRKLAPYKFSFALDREVSDPGTRDKLMDLAKLLHFELITRNISALLPDFQLDYDEQIADNLHVGVVYSVVLNENTLQDGIFHLLNSSTMLKEQVHVADFASYADLLNGK